VLIAVLSTVVKMYVRVDNAAFRGCMHKSLSPPVSDGPLLAAPPALPESGVYSSKLKIEP
jgi:hypothetical protein